MWDEHQDISCTYTRPIGQRVEIIPLEGNKWSIGANIKLYFKIDHF